jgi:hypothetical protein
MFSGVSGGARNTPVIGKAGVPVAAMVGIAEGVWLGMSVAVAVGVRLGMSVAVAVSEGVGVEVKVGRSAELIATIRSQRT